jgi:phosphate transport system substrate-binding protein
MSDGFDTDASEGTYPGERPRAPRRRRRRHVGILAWLIIAICAVIAIGTGTLAWMAWSFQVESTRRAAIDLGLVPVTRDFAPGQPKPADVLFRIAGSSTLNDVMLPDLAAAWMRGQGWSGVSISRDGQVASVSGSKEGRTGRVLVVSGSASGGFEAMIERRVEGVASLRPIDPSEADRLSAYGDMTSAANERIIGLIPELVVVNRANAVDAIGGDTLGRMLSGEITDWSEVTRDGSGPIQVKLMAERSDGTAASELLGDREPPETVQRFRTAQEVIDAVSRSGGSIGIAMRTDSVGSVKPLIVGERNARMVEPDLLSIATEAYPFTRRARLYVGTSGADPSIRSFADFTLTPTGQTIVQRSGLVSQPLEAVQFAPPPDAPTGYINFARDARRMNFDLRFHLGSSELDSKGVADIDRFVRFIQSQQIEGRRIALLGFADNVGARATNLGLAQARIETVANVLRQRGMSIGLLRAYGDQMPVGANANEAGRIRNRRVEIWICPPPACPALDLAATVTAAPTAPPRGLPTGVRLGRPKAPAPGEEAPKG